MKTVVFIVVAVALGSFFFYLVLSSLANYRKKIRPMSELEILGKSKDLQSSSVLSYTFVSFAIVIIIFFAFVVGMLAYFVSTFFGYR